MASHTTIVRVFTQLLDVLLPCSCACCNARTGSGSAVFCTSCNDTIEHAPWPVLSGSNDSFEGLFSPFFYGGPIADAIVGFKYSQVPSLGSRLAHFAVDSVELPKADVVVPVPLHPSRLASRGFNQASVIARAVARRLGSRFLPVAIERVRNTASQRGRSAAERRRNVRAAFEIPPKRISGIDGKEVLLVDDVWTTGATCGECAKVLGRAGAKSVHVFTLARVM